MRGRTTLLCTHNLAEAEALCDDVIILRKGVVLLHESLASLRHRQKPRARLNARQGAPALIEALRKRNVDAMIEEGGVIASIDPQREAPELLRALLAEGIAVYECTPLTATLEDLFLEAVRT